MSKVIKAYKTGSAVPDNAQFLYTKTRKFKVPHIRFDGSFQNEYDITTEVVCHYFLVDISTPQSKEKEE